MTGNSRRKTGDINRIVKKEFVAETLFR